ncbi:MAG: DUF2950 domain-containing protein [Planctomycetes bacterium]|jgi:hypothetical protein|nr:DUF2950 domain-containing protein [Planctomycetota bacterium]
MRAETQWLRFAHRTALLSVLTLLVVACRSTSSGQQKFATPEEAMAALADLIGQDDSARVDAVLGEGAYELLSSGDPVIDREDAGKVKEMILEGVDFADEDGQSIAYIGGSGWPFPIPLVQDEGGWRFDLEAGHEEILTRRIGRNELVAVATMRALAEAQHEYAAVGRDGKPPCFAAKLWSEPGLHDGLYWETAEGEPESPMGPLVAEATEEGYTRQSGGPVPYHGYCFRLLTGQGAHAPGGAKDYLDGDGLLTKGFAVVAWPATYGNSGIMTFLVNQQGIVFERDLGEDTPAIVKEMKAYDPGADWYPSEDVED